MKPGFIIRLLLLIAFILVCSTRTYGAHLGSNSYPELVLHYSVSAGITFVTCRAIALNRPDLSLSGKYLLSSSVALIAGFGKEIIDVASNKKFDFIDIGFDVLGIASGLALHYFLFDKKNIKASIAFNISGSSCLATIKIRF